MANISKRQLRNNEKLINGLENGTVNPEKFLEEYVPTRQEIGQFFTPKEVVNKILSFACIEQDEKVLEPSCGIGNILYYLPKDAIGIELDHKTAELARKITKREIVESNLFSVYKDYLNTFDCIVGNPPFGNTAGRKYLEHQLEVGETRAEIMAIECIYHMLKEGGRAILLLPTMISKGGRNYSKLYKFIEKYDTCLEMVYNCGVVDFKTTKINVGIYEMWK
ncbi:N-6 DNA methylase [Caminicella sporogenes]|uniref:N-6 DNA methylase n=1 Tax=Caminicella sporogenes TaxID=166485 RepID=UPI002540BE69|nr:N-6 DNA methylase [Caminicella sporogenes]WIF94299.1 N-6 DNA methylase [Caminicella sporogenes]